MLRAVGFDLGHTLIRNSGIPRLSWHESYAGALECLASELGCELSPEMADAGTTILTRYNTRLTPRIHEVTSDVILGEILDAWELGRERLDSATRAFFGFFRQDVCVLPDAVPCLRRMRELGLSIGVLTDVPYGMARHYVVQDVEPFSEYIDVLLTSVDVGWRKPEPHGFLALSERLGVPPEEMVYVGDESKDIVGAKAVGMRAVFIDRGHGIADCGEDLRIQTLGELEEGLQTTDHRPQTTALARGSGLAPIRFR